MPEESQQERNDSNSLTEVISAGSDVAGSVAGAAIGFVAGGPPGAVLGGAAAGPLLTRSLRWVAGEIKQRLMGPREEVRVGATLAYGIAALQERIQEGETLRTDGFFEAGENERSAADEVIEGTLLVAQRSSEEKKLPFLGNLLASIALDPSISRAHANHLLQQFEALSYRQIVMLRTFAMHLYTREDDFRGQASYPMPLIYVLSEALDLYNRGLINNGGDVMFGPADLHPSRVTLQGVGAEVHNFARLWTLDDPEVVAELMTWLNQPATPASA